MSGKIILVAQFVKLTKTNVLERAGKQGTDLIIDYLFGWKGPAEIARELRANGHSTTDSNVRKNLDRYKDEYENKKPMGIELITNHMVKTRMTEIQTEFQNTMIQDPLLVLHKNIYELEQMKHKNNDLKMVGSILELQSKFAASLAKLQPPKTVKININQLLERNDLGVNFIIQMDSKYPELGLKDAFLEFVQANSDDV